MSKLSVLFINLKVLIIPATKYITIINKHIKRDNNNKISLDSTYINYVTCTAAVL